MKLYKNLAEAVREALNEIFLNSRYADKVLEKVLKKNQQWGSRDRRFIAETTYDMVRWWRLLHEISGIGIGEYSPKYFYGLFGAYLVLKKEDLPPWDELRTVSTAGISEKLDLFQNHRKIRESIPDWLDNMGLAELGELVWEREIRALNEEARVAIRSNTLKTTREDLQSRLTEKGIDTEWAPLAPEGLLLCRRQNLFLLPEFKEGLFELQDISSQRVGHFLHPEPGMRVIDACAGAGGKTLHIAALMKNKGKIIALDKEQWKLDELKKRARRAGVSNIETRLADSNKTIKRLEESADLVLLDVPCSGTGVLKRNPDAKWKLSIEQIERIKKEQSEILQNYSRMAEKGGKIVYVTCSIFSSENEKQVQHFINNNEGKFQKTAETIILPSEGFDGFYMTELERK